MTIVLGDKPWTVEAEAFLAEYDARPPEKRARFVLACEACRQLCTIPHPCESCAKFGKAFGGKRVRTISPHVTFPIADVVDRLRRAVAA